MAATATASARRRSHPYTIRRHVTPATFRKLALSQPQAVEGSHMGHADFRVGGKIFASLGPDEDWAMVKLSPDDQADLIGGETGPYKPASGAWGVQGCTIITLRRAGDAKVRRAEARPHDEDRKDNEAKDARRAPERLKPPRGPQAQRGGYSSMSKSGCMASWPKRALASRSSLSEIHVRSHVVSGLT